MQAARCVVRQAAFVASFALPFSDSVAASFATPLVLATNGEKAVRFAPRPVAFDIYGTGDSVLVSWPETGFAFLGLDLNSNGRIDDGRELFGDATIMLKNVRRTAATGFEALGQYDYDRNGFIDEHDPIWPRLLLWGDGDRDGVCDAGELVSLGAHGVAQLSLDSLPVKSGAQNEGAPLLHGHYQRSDNPAPQLLADVWLRIYGE